MNGADQIENEIKTWIQNATDPTQKALLMILYQMNQNLTDNTVTTRGIAEDFHLHRNRIDTLLNRLKGGWFALGIAFVAIQAMAVWIFNTQLNAFAKEVDRNERQEARIILLEQRASENDRRLTVIENAHRFTAKGDPGS